MVVVRPLQGTVVGRGVPTGSRCMESWIESAAIECACGGSTCASMSAGRSSQQISIENGRSFAGMNPGGMSTRDANATSMMLAISVRLFRLPGLKRISQAVILGGGILPAKATQREPLTERQELMAALI